MPLVVRGEGPTNAKMYIFGEAPGEQEAREGRPFCGSAGSQLDSILLEVGILRTDVYVDNLVQERPPRNKFRFFLDEDHQPKPILFDGIQRVRRIVQSNKPNLCILLGNNVIEHLLGFRNIMSWRGSVLKNGFLGKVMPTLHPAFLRHTDMRTYSQTRPLLVADFRKAKEEATFPELRQKQRRSVFVEDLNALHSMRDVLMNADRIAFDIETRNRCIACIGFADTVQRAFVLPLMRGLQSAWLPEEEPEVWHVIQEVLGSGVPKVAQNAPFDILYLHKEMGIRVEGLYMDTMLAHHTAYSELPKALEVMCSLYTDQPFYKDPGTTDRSLWEYNGLDCMICLECSYVLDEELHSAGLTDFHRRHVFPLLDPLMEMEGQGVKIDLERRKEAKIELEEEIKEVEAQLNETAGHPLNPRSPKQVAEYLYRELRLPEQLSRKTRKVTTEEDALRRLMKKHPVKALTLILKIRGLSKLLGTYIEAPLDPDGRMRCSYNITGTKTGRISSSRSLSGSGTNLQNVPHGPARQMFVPDQGNIFVCADLSQAENRYVAYDARDVGLMHRFEKGQDVHRFVASMVVLRAESKITDAERYIGKRTGHAANYGLGKNKLADMLGCKPTEAQGYLDAYFAHFPSIRDWQREREELVSRTRILTNPLGRRRIFFGRWGSELFREAYAQDPQSTIADLLNTGLVNMHLVLPENCMLRLHIHDAIVVECPKEKANEVIEIMKRAMTIPFVLHHKEVVIPVGFKVGENWDVI